jgi:6-phosphofructokinase 2
MKLAQFVGSGAEGDEVCGILDEMLGEEAMGLTIRPAGGLRTCTSIVASDSTTELVEPSATISSSEMKQLFDCLSKEQASALCIMGSMPPGCPADTYARTYKSVVSSDTLCLIDSVAGLDDLWETIANTESKGSTVLKVNAAELCRLADVSTGGSETSGVEQESVVSAVKTYFSKSNAIGALDALAITDGSHPAYLVDLSPDKKEFCLFQLPVAKLDESRTLYPIGAGDSVAAGTLAAWKCLSEGCSDCLTSDVQKALQEDIEKQDPPTAPTLLTAFSFGLACGSASCLQEENSVVSLKDVTSLFNKGGRPTFLAKHKL